MSDQQLPDIRMEAENLYREELFTDRHVGSIRRLQPVTSGGKDDAARAVIFTGETQIMTPAGPLPLSFELDAKDLAEAVANFGERAREALEQTVRQLEEMRRDQASSIVVPGQGGGMGGPGGMGGMGGPAGPGGGFKL
jgi:hypothetical protein